MFVKAGKRNVVFMCAAAIVLAAMLWGLFWPQAFSMGAKWLLS